jgi:Zn-finger protein
MHYCPFCGHLLEQTLKEGISSCSNCHRVFDSCSQNRILSAAWQIRRRNLETVEEIEFLSIEELEFVKEYILDKRYCHDEFLKLLPRKVS